YSQGSADNIYAYGANGLYTYTYGDYYPTLYGVGWGPLHYGAITKDLGTFLDDTVTVHDHLTLNLGVRFDHDTGSIPDFDRLEAGTPSLTQAGNFKSTGEKIPGIKNLIRWNLVSPRLGFVWQTRNDGRAAFRGSFGIYYDHDVSGNWDTPPPDVPPVR